MDKSLQVISSVEHELVLYELELRQSELEVRTYIYVLNAL
jgi:hypothetical protein